MVQLPWHPDFETRKAIRLAHLREPTGGGDTGGGTFDLPDGEFPGQIIIWDGAEWVPYTGPDVSKTAPAPHNITPALDRPPVTGFRATAPSRDQINLSWVAPSRTDGLLGYRLRRSCGLPSGGVLTSDIWYRTTDVDKSATAATDTYALRPSLTYRYEIWARYENGDSDPASSSASSLITNSFRGTSPLDTPEFGAGWGVGNVSWSLITAANPANNKWRLTADISGRPAVGGTDLTVAVSHDFTASRVRAVYWENLWTAPPLFEEDVDGLLNRSWAVPSLTQLAAGVTIDSESAHSRSSELVLLASQIPSSRIVTLRVFVNRLGRRVSPPSWNSVLNPVAYTAPLLVPPAP